MLSRQQKKVLSHRQVQMESLELRALLTGACIDFESLAMGAVYHVGDAFVADPTGFQAKITGEPFTTSIGSVITTGRAIVVGTGLAGDTGLELSVNNIVLDFDFSVAGSLPGLKLSFGEYGGNLNLEINGDFRNFNDFQDVDGTIIGGTFVTVPTGGLGNDKGVLYVDGLIDSFKIGGQEFALDHVCTDDSFTGATFDWGDAPEKPYRTRAIANGAVHRIEPGVYLGRRVDAEPDGQPTAMADGDDAALVLHPDDEDGVTFLGAIVPGSTANVEVVASTKGVLNAWIDFNRDGQWSSGAPEQVFVSKLLSAGVNTLSFTVPKDAVVDSKLPTFSRWRFSTSHAVLEPIDGVVINGERLIPNGEVEDHVVFIQPAEPTENYDFGDAPDNPYPTLLVHNGARHVVDPNFYLGAGVDSETDGRPNRTATGDDLLGGDEDGVTFMTPLVAGRTARIRVVASQPGKLDAWIDYDADGKWEPHEAIASSLSVNKGDNFLSITVPPWAVDGTTFSRFRLSRLGGLSPVGAALDGEVEDHLVTIEGRQPTGPAEPIIELATNSEQGSSGIVIFPEPTFANVDAAGQEWTQMFSAGAENLLGKVGTPAVPVLRRLIAVPAGASVTASLQEAPRVVQTWQVNLMPIQPAAPDVDEAPPDSVFDDPSGFAYDAELYASQVSYPNYGIKVTPIGKLRDLEVAVVEIPTANYTPATGELNVFGEVKWKVEFAGGKGFLPENSANPFENSDSQYDLVLNKDIIRERLYPGDVNAFAGEELLILTHPDFREAADKLAEWKRDKGIMTSVYEVGTGTPYDTSDEIKNLIQVRYDNTVVRASYVLLLGDTEFIPTFYRHSYYSGGTGGPNIELNQDYFGGMWNPYGTINFNADGTEYIDVVRKTREYDVTDTGATVADAIRLVHVDSGTEVIVDNLSPGFSMISGTWTESAATDEYNGSSLISYDDEARARFTPTLTKPGLYQVYARWSNMSGLTPINRDSEALLNVVSNSTGTDTPYTFLSGGLIDLLPDVANGRIPVDTLPDAMTVVDKIIAYEQTPPGSVLDDAFYDNVSIASQFQGYRDGSPTGRDKRGFIEESENSRNTLMDAGKTVERIYTKTEDADQISEEPNRYYDGRLLPADLRVGSGFAWDGDTADITSAINDGRFLVIHRDHGWPSGWGHPDYSTFDLSSLHNGALEPVVYSINCASGFFDNETSGNMLSTSPTGSYFTELMLRRGNGAVGLIGDTRNSNTWSNNIFLRGLIDATWQSHDSTIGATPTSRLGDILNYAKTYTLLKTGVPSTTEPVELQFSLDTLNLYHVYGDPTLEMWTSNPHDRPLVAVTTILDLAPLGITLSYEKDGTTITAYQYFEGQVFPLGRDEVEDGKVTLELIAEPKDGYEILYSACSPGSVCRMITPGPTGDINEDGKVDVDDIDLLCALLRNGTTELRYDLNQDNIVSAADKDWLIHDLLGTYSGDANLDGVFNSTDLIKVFQVGEYEDAIPNNSTWAEGDWNCDQDFTTGDLVTAFQEGGYLVDAVMAAVQARDVAATPNRLIDVAGRLSVPSRARVRNTRADGVPPMQTLRLKDISQDAANAITRDRARVWQVQPVAPNSQVAREQLRSRRLDRKRSDVEQSQLDKFGVGLSNSISVNSVDLLSL